MSDHRFSTLFLKRMKHKEFKVLDLERGGISSSSSRMQVKICCRLHNHHDLLRSIVNDDISHRIFLFCCLKGPLDREHLIYRYEKKYFYDTNSKGLSSVDY